MVVWRAMGQSVHGGGVPLNMTLVHVLLFENGKDPPNQAVLEPGRSPRSRRAVGIAALDESNTAALHGKERPRKLEP